MMIDWFKKEKTDSLSKTDRSKAASIDRKIVSLCKRINSLDNYYTTSSCSGRILLLEMDREGKKNKVSWLYLTHGKADAEDFISALAKMDRSKEVWFRFEPQIIHAACRDVDSALSLTSRARDAGMKRSGIISGGRRFMVEIIGTGHISTIAAERGRILISDDLLRVLVERANKKLADAWKQIDKLERLLED